MFQILQNGLNGSLVSILDDQFQKIINFRHALVQNRLLMLLETNLINKINTTTPSSTLMAAKASQLYVLFQNKAHHYQNLQQARSKVEDHLSTSVNNTINAVCKQKYDRDFPKSKRYLVQTENKSIANRIQSISHADRREIVADGSYARYNRFQRNFRTINHYKNEEERQIQIQNQKIKQKIERMKSSSTKYWHSEYKKISLFVKKKPGEELNTSRTSLHIEKKPFLAQPYLQFLTHLKKDKKIVADTSKAQLKEKDGQSVKLETQNMFVLPQFHYRQQKLKRSKASMTNLSQAQTQPKPQNATKKASQI